MGEALRLGGKASLKAVGARSGGFAAAALATFVTYVGVSGSLSVGEAAYGAAVALVGALAVVAAMRLAGVRQRLELKWLGRLGRPCLDVVTQIAPLSVALGAALIGRGKLCASISERPFDPGGTDDPVAAGRRSLVGVGLSIAPASLICERDLDCHELMVATIGLKALDEAGVDPCWPL